MSLNLFVQNFPKLYEFLQSKPIELLENISLYTWCKICYRSEHDVRDKRERQGCHMPTPPPLPATCCMRFSLITYLSNGEV